MTLANDNSIPAIDDIIETFALIDTWDDRYRYIIELGRRLPPLAEEAYCEANRVQGCVSQVWLVSRVEPGSPAPLLYFLGDSDAHIVKGLMVIVFALFSGKSAQAILDTSSEAVFSRLELKAHLTPQRSNGLASLILRIKSQAQASLEA